jgi:hypothetical protein
MSRRLLQVFAVVNVLVAFYNGGRFLFLGIDAEPGSGGVDLWYRVLGWFWITSGLMLAWITPRIEVHTAWFRLIFVAFMSVGLGRLAAVAAHGVSAENTVIAIAIEIAVPLACIVWQGFVARAARVSLGS